MRYRGDMAEIERRCGEDIGYLGAGVHLEIQRRSWGDIGET